MTALPVHAELAAQTAAILTRLGVQLPTDGTLIARSPVTGGELARVAAHSREDAARIVGQAQEAFHAWRSVPAPVRGQLVRELGELLREHKADLGALVSIEAGKIRSEGLGEVQEMIDICDLAVGLSRQLFGLTIASERPGHRMMEQWHPLGVVGVISAFNFPVAVWSWNAALAFVCGDPVVWKPSEKTLLTALACQALVSEAARRVGAPAAVSSLLVGGAEVGEALVEDPRVALLSATGSTRMGRAVAPKVAARFGRLLLELGGNNAAIVAPSADLDLAVRGIVFSAAGTAGQRCTTLRRVIAHSSIADELVDRIAAAYRSLPIGSPVADDTLVGPLIDRASYEGYLAALAKAQANGGELVVGGSRVLADESPEAFYVEPAVVRMPSQSEIVQAETFAPILYVMTYDTIEEALELHNDVPQGLSSAIFTLDLREAERFLSPAGSDCGIANVNIGPSGAEIGGAFGGEKETGGGRESGSDAWKSYMRRATNTVNYSTELPLAQGVQFGYSWLLGETGCQDGRMQTRRHLDELAAHGQAMADLLATGPLDVEVPTCPGWQLRDLLAHTGMVHRWAALNVGSGPDPDTGRLRAEQEREPSGDDPKVAWFREGHARLLSTLCDAPQDVRAVCFLANAGTPLQFWARRQAHETAIHCFDAASARGEQRRYAAELAADFALDGVAELLEGFFGRRSGRLRSDTERTLAVQAEAGPRWTVRLGPNGHEISRVLTDGAEPGSADAVVRATPGLLYLFLWNRLPLDAVEVEGDVGLLELWQDKARVAWS